jgi:tripartite motif-containing protein 71
VVDAGNDRIQQFSSTGAFIRSVGHEGTGDGSFSYPNDIKIDRFGHLWVTDDANRRIEEFDASGNFLSKFNTIGSGQPTGLAIGNDDTIWVSDWSNGVIKHFGRNGTLLQTLGSGGSGAGQFGSPWGVAQDTSGNIWVVPGNSFALSLTSISPKAW